MDADLKATALEHATRLLLGQLNNLLDKNEDMRSRAVGNGPLAEKTYAVALLNRAIEAVKEESANQLIALEGA